MEWVYDNSYSLDAIGRQSLEKSINKQPDGTDTKKDTLTETNEQQSEINPTKETETKDGLPDGGWAWRVVFGSFMCNVVLGM